MAIQMSDFFVDPPPTYTLPFIHPNIMLQDVIASLYYSLTIPLSLQVCLVVVPTTHYLRFLLLFLFSKVA